jgi:hypothetical protein
MKYLIAIGLGLVGFSVRSQPCQLLTQTFAIADTIKKDSKELYRFRFSDRQLADLESVIGLDKAVPALRKLQKTLDEDNASLTSGFFWQLDEKLADKQLGALKKECPETLFGVFQREIDFYKSKFKEKQAGQ